MAGIPNQIRIFLLAFLPTKNTLNSELEKCTIPVIPMANSTGKKAIKTGVNKVPKPNPEKKVKTDAPNATNGIAIISMLQI